MSEWRDRAQLATPQKFFNMKHSSIRNVIDRTFGLLKGLWAILRAKSFYPIKTQGKIIIACCLLHNHIRQMMAIDPLEVTLQLNEENGDWMHDLITHVETSEEWTT